MAVMYFPKSAFAPTKGELRYHSTGSMRRGENKRRFCAECGSRVSCGESERGIDITASNLDNPSAFQPQFDIQVADVQAWDQLDPAIPKFEHYPPRLAQTPIKRVRQR